jgi:hypothetical protein
LLWSAGILIVIAGTLFAIGYFYYGKIIKNYAIEAVSRESNGLYKAEIDNLSIDVLNGNLTIKRFHIIPDTVKYHQLNGYDSLSPLLVDFKIDEFKIRGFKVMDALKNKRIEVKRILFNSPEVTIYRMKMAATKKDEKKKETMTSIPLPKGLKGIEIKEFTIENAKLAFIDCARDSVVTHNFPVTNINIVNIIVDSTHQGKVRLFNADDIAINLGGYSFLDKKGMNKISFGEIGISTAKKEVYVKNFHLEPQYNAFDYPRKMGYQCDRTDVQIPELKVERLDIRKLLFEGKFIAGLVEIDSILIDDYRDMRVPDRKGVLPPMPHESLRKLKTYLKVDTIVVNNGKAIYYEQVQEKPGMIFFDKMNLTFTGLTNDSVLLAAGLVSELRGETYLMGKGKIDATIRFFFGDKKNKFTFSANVGPMDLREINAMLSYQIPGKIESGQLKKLTVPFVLANDDESSGKLIFYYNNLKVMVEKQDEKTWSKIKTGVINFAANDIIVNNDNPTKSGKLKTGTIYFQRKKQSSIFNFLWKSIFSGLKSTMGFNSDVQKSMIKAEKHRAKKP